MLYENGRPFSSLDSYNTVVCRPTAFIGGTANARGDKDGTDNPHTLFTVTGDVSVRVYGVVTTTIVGAGTIEVGLAGNTALLLPQVADASTGAAADVIVDATLGEVRGVALSAIPGPFLVTNSANIIETVGTADLTAGNIYYVCLWRPITPSGKVETAGAQLT